MARGSLRVIDGEENGLMKEQMATASVMEVEERHRSLARQVDALERRAFLTPDEQRQMSELKKLKLAAKDELFRLRRDR